MNLTRWRRFARALTAAIVVAAAILICSACAGLSIQSTDSGVPAQAKTSNSIDLWDRLGDGASTSKASVATAKRYGVSSFRKTDPNYRDSGVDGIGRVGSKCVVLFRGSTTGDGSAGSFMTGRYVPEASLVGLAGLVPTKQRPPSEIRSLIVKALPRLKC